MNTFSGYRYASLAMSGFLNSCIQDAVLSNENAFLVMSELQNSCILSPNIPFCKYVLPPLGGIREGL